MAGQYSAGTFPRLRHMCGALSETPIAVARAMTLPAHSIARSRACMTALIVTHGRECTAHTIVMQENEQITGVSTFAERLKSARESAGFASQAALARAAGLSPGAIGNWEAGTRHQPRDILSLAKVLGVSPDWLAGNAGNAQTLVAQSAPVAHDMSQLQPETVPSLNWEQLMSEDQKGALPQIFRVGVPDSSMAPRVNPGAMVVLNTAEAPRPGDGVLVRDKTGQVHLREFRAGRPGIWEAHAVNPAYAPLESERDGLTVLAVLMAVEARWG